MFTNVKRDRALHTDESKLYTVLGKEYATHDTVNHAVNHARKEYVLGAIHTNPIEGFFFDLQARHERRVPALRRETSALLPC